MDANAFWISKDVRGCLWVYTAAKLNTGCRCESCVWKLQVQNSVRRVVGLTSLLLKLWRFPKWVENGISVLEQFNLFLALKLAILIYKYIVYIIK